MKLNQRVALVTGGGGGLGYAISEELAREGAKVVVSDINRNAADVTAKRVKELGSEAISVSGDLTKIDDVNHLVKTTMEHFGKIDILVNNVGGKASFVSAIEETEELFDSVMALNMKTTFLVSRQVIPVMLKVGKGTIINIASASGVIASATGLAYTAAKHGVIGITKQLAYDFGQKGIRVNAVSPGTTATRQLVERGLVQEGAPNYELSMQAPAGRYGQPKDTAKTVVFLASDDADFIHGESILVDGGSTIR